MKELPILFSGEMVRAILAGAKTQTRRLYKERKVDNLNDPNGPLWSLPSPYGSPGDRLWVREAIVCRSINKRPPPYEDDVATAVYSADGSPCPLDRWPWQRYSLPGIHMPYGLRRITLEIVEVRVQLLQEISEDDARAEGCKASDAAVVFMAGTPCFDQTLSNTARGAYAVAWDAINGARRRREELSIGDPGYTVDRPWRTVVDASARWAANPWVWAVTFRRVTP